MRNYKFRIYPNHVIEARLGAALEATRWLYNYLLSNKFRTKEDMQFALTELKESEPWLKLYHSKVLQMIPYQIDSARKALKEKARRGYDAGALKYARRDEWKTFTYNQSGFKIERHGDADLLWLSKIGWMEIRLHRQIDGSIKQVTLMRKCGKWYAIIAVDKRIMPRPISPRRSAGIDADISNHAYDSDGNTTPNPENIRKMLKPLVRANRKLSRRAKGSNNYKKAKRWYQIVHERIMNRRKDFQHKLSTHYAKYDTVFMEKLNINNMVRNHNLAMSIMDAGWSTFRNMVDYKAMLVEVPANNTSIECSRCGNMVPKPLAIRTHCDQCGLLIDRDHNASLNILKRGMAIWNLPMEHREVTPVEILKGSGKQEEALSARVG